MIVAIAMVELSSSAVVVGVSAQTEEQKSQITDTATDRLSRNKIARCEIGKEDGTSPTEKNRSGEVSDRLIEVCDEQLSKR